MKGLIVGALALMACSTPSPPSQDPGGVVATIHLSASTNTAAVDVVVHADGSAERTVEPFRTDPTQAPYDFPPGDPDVERFLSDFQAAGDVEHYVIVDCAKSVSFGTTTTITSSAGQTSGDLQCSSPDAPAAQIALAHDCDVLTGRSP